MKKFAIIGCGNGGKAVAAEVASAGHSVSIFEAMPNDDFRKLQADKTLTLKGTMNIRTSVDLVTDNMSEAIEGRDVIMVVVPSFAHTPLFKELLPLLKDGQHLVVVPGNYSTFIAKKMMEEMNITTEITLSEAASLPYACRATSFNEVEIYKKKKVLKIGTYPAGANDEVVSILQTVSDMFLPADNVLEVALDNLNLVVHPLPTLLNIAGIEADPKGWRHYIDGISPVISKNMHMLDDERIAVGNAFGLNLTNIMDMLKRYYGDNDKANIYDYVNSNESPYKDIYGQNVFGRYVTEDLPFLAVPAKQLAEKVGIKTPWLDLLIELGSLVHGVDYLSDGYNLELLGINHMSLDEIKQYIS